MTKINQGSASPQRSTASLGIVYLPSGTGTPVGRFEFIVDPDAGVHVEIGTPVSADTEEGTVVGAVVDMRTVGTDSDPVAADLAGTRIAHLGDVMLATVQVFHSAKMRPVRSGTVRAASAAEMSKATGADKMEWRIPAGVIPLAGGEFAPAYFDGYALLGPESAHLTVGGLSGQAAKTSYIGALLSAALGAARPDHRVAAVIFNVKGEDLIWLDEKPAKGFELTADDLAMYNSMGVSAEPFKDVTVYAPALPAGATGTRSSRSDAQRLGWDLPMVWPYLRYFLGPVVFEDEKVSSFLADFNARLMRHHDPVQRIDTFDKLDRWFAERLSEAEETESSYAWGSHHKATMWRLRRMLMGLVPRCGGLLATSSARPGEDIPVAGWVQGQVIVVDIAGLGVDVQSVVIARTIERLLRAAEDGELGVEHLVVVADELNAFAPSQGGEMAAVKRVLQRVATQGRYAGISLWGAGQKLSKVDELVRDNAATRALGITADGELASGVYGRLPGGLSERIATLPKGWMALSHYSFRSTLLVKFPRPAWRTGKATTSAASRPKTSSVLNLSQRSVERLTEGVHPDLAEDLINGASSSSAARAALEAARIPDMKTTALHEPLSFDPDNPFDIS
jgi:hypothetical protein